LKRKDVLRHVWTCFNSKARGYFHPKSTKKIHRPTVQDLRNPYLLQTKADAGAALSLSLSVCLCEDQLNFVVCFRDESTATTRALSPISQVSHKILHAETLNFDSILNLGSNSISTASAMAVTVKALYIYPVKSCRGISVPHASITPTGTSLGIALVLELVSFAHFGRN